MVQSVDYAGNVTAYEYDDAANLTRINYPDGTFESFTYDANGNNLTATDRSGLTVSMTYDKLNRLSEKTYADGTKESYSYDAVGNVITHIGTSGAVTQYTYDNRNRNTAITDGYGNTTTFGYDTMSRLISMTDAKGNTITYEYNNNGNITKTTYPDGNSIQASYDARGRMICQTNQYGEENRYEYDGADRLTKVTDAYGNSYSYGYDGNGNLVTVTDANDNITAYTYDAMGRVATITNAAGKTMSYTYDETGNLTEYINYAGIKTTYTYDGMDRLVQKAVGDEITTYTYNNVGYLTGVTDGSGTISFAYDAYNRIASQTDARGITLTYTYDEAGRLHTLNNGFGTTTHEYDLLDRLTRVIDRNGQVTVYEYDILGNRSAVHYPNGTVMTYTYDACQRLTEETLVDGNGTLLARYTYGIGKIGERLTVTETDAEGTVTGIAYEYDKLSRLVKETITKGENQLVQEYEYDAVSNRIRKTVTVTGDINVLADVSEEEVELTEGTTNYTYNELNQLVKEERGDTVTTYTYDDNGNLIEQSGEKNIRYSYDNQNRLIRATIQKGNQVTIEAYTYDYAGNRTSKTVDETLVARYVNDVCGGLTQVVAETDANGIETAYYTIGQERISMERGDSLCYYLYDGYESVRYLSDETGVITDRYSYDAYGNLLEKEGTTENDFLYRGEQYNANTRLYYLRARYMDPSTGTFISMDSYPGSIDNPVSLHKYLYANANPVTYSDPSGYFSLVESTVVTKIQSILSGLHHSAQIMKIMKWVDITCTVYDVAMQIREVYVAGGSMEDVLTALVHGVIVNFMIDGMCKTGLGVVLKPIMATVGLADQMDQVMEAFKSGKPDQIVHRLLQLMTMTYGLTRQCFTGETLVATENGLQEIATIEVGDFVWAEDTETGEKKLQEVLSVHVGETSTLVHVVTEGGTRIDTTECHPFYVEGEGWKAAAELEAGDILRGLNGDSQKVVSVETEVLETPVQVYNLEVDEYHTYFVSADEVLVHNNYDAADGPSGGKGDKHSTSIPVQEKTKAKNGLFYKSNEKHTPGQISNRPDAGIEPRNSLELFENSVSSTKKSNVRFTYDEETSTLHRFFFDGVDTWHWSGSTNQGVNSITSSQVPIDIIRLFNLPRKGW